MKTNHIFKGREGWEGRAMTETDANGKAWQISTYKRSNGTVACTAIEGDAGEGTFSFEMFGARQMNLASTPGPCTEKKVREVHAAGLIEFEKQYAAFQGQSPSYVIEPGQVVFTDGPYESQKRVIYEIERPGHYKTVTMDGQMLRREDHIKPYSQKFGIGVYYNEGEKMELPDVLKLVESAKKATADRDEAARIKHEQEQADRLRKIKTGRAIISALPKGTEAVIVAEHRIDKSDSQSDYYAHHTDNIIYLSFSTHKRDLFAEMRKAAAKSDIEGIRIYADADREGNTATTWDNKTEYKDEHREKYSMGEGYYLGASKYSGWVIRKIGVYGNGTDLLELLQRAAAEGRFLCNTEDNTPDPVNVERVEVEPGTVQIIEYGKGLAVLGAPREYADQLGKNGLRGIWQPRLSCGPGWIFPKNKLADLQALFGATPEETPEQEEQPYTIETTDKGKFYTLNNIPDGTYKGKKMTVAYFGAWTGGNSDRLSIKYGKKESLQGLFWTGGSAGLVYLQALHGGSYADIKLEYDQFENILSELGAVNELNAFRNARAAWEKPDEPEGEQSAQEQPRTIEQTRQIATVQNSLFA